MHRGGIGVVRNGRAPRTVARWSTVLAAAALAASQLAAAGPIQDVKPGTWYEIPNSKLRSVVPSAEPAGDAVGIMDAWSGGVYDTDRQQLVIWGGGHVDYAGNEVYAFGPLTSDTPRWTRLSDPSPSQTGSGATYSDGKPRSTHTYNTLAYDPTVGRMMSMGLGSVWNSGSEERQIFGFDLASNKWDSVSTHPSVNGGAQGASAAFDSSTGLIWYRGAFTAGLQSYDTSAHTLKSYDDGFGSMNIEFVTTIDPNRHIMVGVGGYGSAGPLNSSKVGVLVWDLTNPGNSFVAKTSGGSSVEGRDSLGFQFHPGSKTFIAWFGGATVWRLTPPSDLRNGTWQWTQVGAAAGSATPTSENARGTYGRFRYVPGLDLFVAVNRIDENVYVYRLPDSTTPTQPVITLQASPTTVALQGTSTLTWSSTNATSCTASGGWSGSKATSGTQAVGPLAATATFTLTCDGNGGSANKSVTVTVDNGTPAPTVNLSADPATIPSGSSSVLSWSSSNATSCTAGGAWSGSKATSGSQAIGPLTASRTYDLTCTGSGGSTQRSATVTVTAASPPPPPPAPTLTLTASASSVTSGGNVTLNWSSTNTTSCNASGGWTGSKAVSGIQAISSLTANTTFNLQCTGAGGNISKSVSVSVTAPTPPPASAPTVTLNAGASSVSMGGGTTLTWSSTNATSCSASGSWSGTKTTSGSQDTGGLNADATFDLTCTGTGGSAMKSVTVTVTAAPTNPPANPPTAPAEDPSSGGGGAMNLWSVLSLLGLVLLRAFSRKGSSNWRTAAGWVRNLRRSFWGVLLIGLGVPTVCGAGVDVTTVKVYSTGSAAQTSVPVTVGQVFKPGDVASGSTIAARTASGTAVTLQVDKKATHSDGSLRHAVLSFRVPSLGANANESIILSAEPSGSAGTPVSLSALLATSFDATVDVTVGGTVYSASAKSLLQAGGAKQWLSGPVASEWIVGGPVRTSGGAAHPHLAAYFHVRAYAPLDAVRVDVVVENGWSYVANPGNFTYDVNVKVGGTSRYSKSGLQHYHHARWHKVFWWGINQPAVNPQLDKAYLTATKAVSHYLPLTPTSSFLSARTVSVEPMDIGDNESHMPDGGASPSIGPLPAAPTAYLLSDDDRARRATLAIGDGGAAYSMHWRNDKTGETSSGYPVSLADHPNGGVGSGGDFPTGGSTPYTHDTAHQPSIGYLPYLITGDYFYLEELQFWVNSNWYNGEISNNSRGNGQGLLEGHQERGQAWALRELARAAYITPDDHPLKNLYTSRLDNNRSYYISTYVNSGGSRNNVFGAIDRGALGTDSGRQETKTWMDDFFTWAMGHMLELGFSDWRPMFDFKAKFVLGRLNNPDFCYIMAGNDTVELAASAKGTWYTNWATVYQNTFGTNITSTACGSQAMANALSAGGTYQYKPGEIYNYAELAGSRLAIMHAASAVLVDYGVSGGDGAWNKVRSSTVLPNWDEYANFALAPRGTVTAPPSNPAPTLSLSASPTSVASGSSSTLTWSSSNATSCTASGGWTGSKATSGSQSSGALTSNTTFTLQCTGAGGSVSRSATVTITTPTPPPPPPPAGAPTVSITANPTSVASGGSSTLTWLSTNATSCTASGGWSGSKAISGTQSMTNLTANRTFTLACTGSGGTTSASATVTVTSTPPPPTPPPAPPTVDLMATSSSVTSGTGTSLSWTSTNATSCSAGGGWSGSQATSGTAMTGALTSTTTFQLTCTGAGGTQSDSVTVTVTAAPAPPATPTPPTAPAEDPNGGGGAMEWASLLALLALFGRRVRSAARASVSSAA
jgi:hypothetical protein